MKRFNTKENFEEVYLRIKELKLGLKAMSKKKTIEFVQSKPFKNAVNKKFNDVWWRNSKLFYACGFTEEDIKTILTLYGVSFLRCKFQAKTEKDMFYILTRYMSQKFSVFLTVIKRKFTTQEIRETISLNGYMGSTKIGLLGIYENSVETEEEVVQTKSSVSLESMRQELDADFDKYKTRILEMSISKDISYEVRRAARMLCKKRGLDYQAFAKEFVANNKVNPNDYYLE